MKTILGKFLLVALLIAACVACGGSDDENDVQQKELQEEHDNLMQEYLTPDIRNVLNTFEFEIHEGINPPNVTGYYSTMLKCIKSNRKPVDFHLGWIFNNSRYYFHNQQKLHVDMIYHQVDHRNNDKLAGTSTGSGMFISGSGNYFSIFFKVKTEVKNSNIEVEELLVISGELYVDTDGKVIGIKDYNQVLLMIDNQGYTSQFLGNGEGRMFEDDNFDYSPAITKEQFENFTKSAAYMKAADSSKALINSAN